MSSNNRLVIFAVVLVIVTVLVKFFCAPNLGLSGFTTILALALFAGMSIKQKRFSFLLPLVAVFMSDLIIEVLYRLNLFVFAGFYKNQLINYSLLLATTLIGWAIKGNKASSIFLACFAGPTSFFLLSNLTVWFFSTTTYSKDFSGLLLCYQMGLPFYKKALISTFIFLPAILVGYNYLVQAKTKFTLAK